MLEPHSKKQVITLLKQHNISTSKALGQNFLIDPRVLKRILETANIQPTNTVFEVGSGLGILTQQLAKSASKVIAVELDKKLLPILAKTLEGFGNLELINTDALLFDLKNLPENSLFVANLPYNIATAMVLRVLESGRFKKLVCLVQKEVAEKICAQPIEKAFGSFSLIIKHFANAKIIRHVKPTSFFPQPKVTSSIVCLDVIPEAKPEQVVFNLIYDAFRHRRKTLKKNLLMAGYEINVVKGALKQVGVDEMARAETLKLEQFKNLAKLLPTVKTRATC